MTTFEKVKDIVIRIVHCDEQEITPTTTWKEETFDFEVSDEAAEGLTNFGNLVAYIDRCLAEQGELA